MCGIAGFWSPHGIAGPEADAITRRMARAIWHRGPDDEGQWSDPACGVALAHRRLSIIDLSAEGHQPMHSASGRYVIVFNGEIYNFKAIRAELDTVGVTTGVAGSSRWRGHSDTEIMLAAIEQWGLEGALQKFVGMFAFALWDRNEALLHLVRDRVGEKPLYYGWVGSSLAFASELKALRAHPDWQQSVDRDALALFIRYSYVPAPYTIYSGIHKLSPGTILTVSRGAAIDRKMPRPKPYWSARQVAEEGSRMPFAGDEADAAMELDRLLRESVRQQMVSDVPLGAFLSGGVDSSAVVAMMQGQSSRPIKTFTVGFKESAYNEAESAKVVARHLGTDHTDLYLTPEESRSVIPKLPALYDEPFADSSQIPTYLVSVLARQHVTVCLSGDGGDELFGGYNRYFLGAAIWRKLGWMPRPVKRLMSRSMSALSPRVIDTLFGAVSHIIPRQLRYTAMADKLRKLAEILVVDNSEDMHLRLLSHWIAPETVVIGSKEPTTSMTDHSQWARLPDLVERMMFLDLINYLPDDILVKVDRAAMGVSLETRVPFLDHRIVEFAWRLPQTMKIHQGQGKRILRQVLYKYVRPEMLERPKMGFGIPIGDWLRGPLRDWAESLLDEKRLRCEEFFNPVPIREKWREHLSGRHDWQYYLWDILMFQAWFEANRESCH